MEDLARIAARLDLALDPGGATGLLAGDTSQPVRRVLFATEMSGAVAAEARGAGADLLVTLHPPAELHLVGEGGSDLRSLIRADIALYSSGAGAPGVIARALSRALDLQDPVPLVPVGAAEYALLVVYAPEGEAPALRDALAAAGAGAIGDYTGCAWSVTGTGEFTPLPGADPTIGAIGTHEQVAEARLEMVVPLALIDPVTAALRAHHPYEEPAFSFLRVHPAPGRRGRGRVGDLPERMHIVALADSLEQALGGAHLRVSGSGEVGRVAVCSSPDGEVLTAAARAGADVLIGADLNSGHLAAADLLGLLLVDVPLQALQWAALPSLASVVAQATDGEVETIVSTTRGPTWHTAPDRQGG